MNVDWINGATQKELDQFYHDVLLCEEPEEKQTPPEQIK